MATTTPSLIKESPSKAEELEILLATAHRLGKNSYCGPWLDSVIKELECDMANDLPPAPSVAYARDLLLEANKEVKAAQDRAQEIIKAAREAGEKEIEKARERANNLLWGARSALNAAMRELDR